MAGTPSTNIGTDSFLPPSMKDATPYLEAINLPALQERVQQELLEPSLIILEGAIAWPAIETVVANLGVNRVSRVYLKRMAHSIPNFWADEDFISDPEWWPPTKYH